MKTRGTFFGCMALVNGGRALLAYFRYSGDVGFTSRDPTYTGPAEATLDFQLSNGQVDAYPVAWTVPTPEALRALEYALLQRARAPWITWHQDG